jgi:hypothetical protein
VRLIDIGPKSTTHIGGRTNMARKVNIKTFSIEMEVKNKGIEFEIRDDPDGHVGDVVLTKTGITWCRGKTTLAKGKFLSWDEFMAMMDGR